MDDPNVFGKLMSWFAREQHRERLLADAAQRQAKERSTRTASIVVIVTILYGVIAFVLIEETKIAALCTECAACKFNWSRNDL